MDLGSATSLSMQCTCGAFKARLERPRNALRVVCYCRDCQSYSHYLTTYAPLKLDQHGGTEVIALAPEHLKLEQGAEQLRCISLSAQGTYRWYTHCCGSAIAVTPRQARLAHVSIAASALRDAGVDVEAAFGPLQVVANRASAHGNALPRPTKQSLFILLYGMGLLLQRSTGRWRENALLQPGTWQPIVPVHVIERTQRQRLLALAEHRPHTRSRIVLRW
ncbi:hypothetical protein E8K88_01890 [Lampropedia aestuarii]|uniref:CENP-V/GFA domain-containing protein n=1 Tax=Lampropedia aestuarii TaxID=2562762 RepID=A0A4S5C0U0_9BURK|nr:DUF6151 family protein [Lampropedia aestuarii]THJ36048.1 hypothetical protein E8K88_01890 [Lampropedia aestuarii]